MKYKNIKTGAIIDVESVVISDTWKPLEQKASKVATSEKTETEKPVKKVAVKSSEK